MGESRSTQNARTVEVAGHMLSATDVDMGNPHTVAFLPSGLALEELDLTRRPALDPEPVDGANIEDLYDAAFYRAKIATARFFADHVLSQADGMRHAIVAGSAGVLGLEIDQF